MLLQPIGAGYNVGTNTLKDSAVHDLDKYILFRCGSSISGKGVHMYKVCGVALRILSHFS